MNVRAAMVHMIGDLVQSVGVVIAAIIIWYEPSWTIADPLCTFLFTFLTLLTTIPIFKECMQIMMEMSPKQLKIANVLRDVATIDEVEEIHDFHVWALSADKFAMSAHIRSEAPRKAISLMNQVLRRHKIYHTTIQVDDFDEHRSIHCDNENP